MPNGKKHKRHKMSTHKRAQLCGMRLIQVWISCHKAFFIYCINPF